MDVLVSSAWSNKGADKRSTIFISLHLQSLFSLHQLSESTSISWFLPSLLFFSILSSMSFLDSGLAMDLGPANPTKQTSQEYGDLVNEDDMRISMLRPSCERSSVPVPPANQHHREHSGGLIETPFLATFPLLKNLSHLDQSSPVRAVEIMLRPSIFIDSFLLYAARF